MGKSYRKMGLKIRPRTRTLTAVHEYLVEDVVGPCNIVGKRTRVSQDGKKLIRIFLDAADRDQYEEKLKIFSDVYRKLTNKETEFSFVKHIKVTQDSYG